MSTVLDEGTQRKYFSIAQNSTVYWYIYNLSSMQKILPVALLSQYRLFSLCIFQGRTDKLVQLQAIVKEYFQMFLLSNTHVLHASTYCLEYTDTKLYV